MLSTNVANTNTKLFVATLYGHPTAGGGDNNGLLLSTIKNPSGTVLDNVNVARTFGTGGEYRDQNFALSGTTASSGTSIVTVQNVASGDSACVFQGFSDLRMTY